MVYYQNPPDKILYFRYLLIYFVVFLNFLFIFYLFFIITITPNPYPRLENGSQIWLSGFWARVDFEPGWILMRVDFERVPKFYRGCTVNKSKHVSGWLEMLKFKTVRLILISKYIFLNFCYFYVIILKIF